MPLGTNTPNNQTVPSGRLFLLPVIVGISERLIYQWRRKFPCLLGPLQTARKDTIPVWALYTKPGGMSHNIRSAEARSLYTIPTVSMQASLHPGRQNTSYGSLIPRWPRYS